MIQKDIFISMEPAICRLNTNDIARYSDWMEQRLLSYELDMDGEYEKEYSKRVNEACAQYADPDHYEPADVDYYANDMAMAHCLGIAEVTGYMIGMAIAGLYHLWEKQVVRHIEHEMDRYNYHGQLKVPYDWNGIKKVFKAHSTDLEVVLADIYPELNELRCVANVMKHGYGPSYDQLKKMEADILTEPDDEVVDEALVESEVLAFGGDHTLLKVEIYPQPKHFRKYCQVVLNFWDELFWQGEGIHRCLDWDGLK